MAVLTGGGNLTKGETKNFWKDCIIYIQSILTPPPKVTVILMEISINCGNAALHFYICKIWHTNWTFNNVLVSYDDKWIYTRVSIHKKFESMHQSFNLQNVYSIFKACSHSVKYTTRILWCMINNYWMRFIVIWKLSNVEVRVISRAEGKDDNSYRDIDNFAYHKNRIQ